jgi:quercetin dioxygenase-like cupin family protein
MSDARKNLYAWPISDKEFRDNAETIVVNEKGSLNLVKGEQLAIIYRIYISNKLITSGKIEIAPFKQSEYEKHKGDETIYLEKGLLTVHTKEGSEEKDYELEPGDVILIPEGIEHKYFNFSKEQVEMIFGIAPEI